MKFLIFLLCLAFVGCSTQVKHDGKQRDQLTSIQRVLNARKDIREIISHVPATPDELADATAKLNRNALIFSAQDYVQRLKTITLEGCPDDFKAAWASYVTAWADRVAMSPKLLIPTESTTAPHPDTESDQAAQHTESTWKLVKAVCLNYGVKMD